MLQQTYTLCAQQQEVRLPAVPVTAPRLQAFSAGLKTTELDSLSRQRYQHSTAATWLQEQTQVFIKPYGIGGLATPSFRGMGAAHTGIVWNGFVLNSALTSSFDLNLLPITVTGSVRLQYGGATALMGSGMVGGSLVLQDEPSFEKPLRWQLSQLAGSFGRSDTYVEVTQGRNKQYSRTAAFFNQAQNNFPFVNTEKLSYPTEQLNNAATLQYGLTHTQGVKLGTSHTLTAHLWLQQNRRHLPTLMSDASTGRAFQADNALRTALSWQYTPGPYALQVRTAYTDEWLWWAQNYAGAGLLSESRLRGSITEVELRRNLGSRWLLATGVHASFYSATSDGIATGATQTRLAALGMLRYAVSRLQADLSLRQEAVDGKAVLPVPTLGARWQLLPGLMLRGHVAGVYRVPTLNEKHWQGAGARGNADLKPESGVSHDAGVVYSLKGNMLSLEASATYFGADVNDWIQWTPTSGVWQPENLQRVQSRGAELDVNTTWQRGRWYVQAAGAYSYTRSVLLTTQGTGTDAEGRQLQYVPQHQGHARLHMGYGSTLLTYQQHAVGERLTAPTGQAFLPAYTVASLGLQQAIQLQAYSLQIAARIHNLYDQAYQPYAQYPMPGRHYSLTLTLSHTHR